MKRLCTLSLALLVALGLSAAIAPAAPGAGASAAETLGVASATITVEGTSNLHDWQVAAKTLRGSLTLPPGFLAGQGNGPAGGFEVPATALRSDKERMNKLMWEALRTSEHPQLAFALQSATWKGADAKGISTVEVRGTLTVAGVSKQVTVPFRVRREGDRLLASGEVPLAMTSFGIQPPTALMGTLKTADAVTVRIEATLQPAS